jgi:hypothetical protein
VLKTIGITKGSKGLKESRGYRKEYPLCFGGQTGHKDLIKNIAA